jgi:hypothetical protein
MWEDVDRFAATCNIAFIFQIDVKDTEQEIQNNCEELVLHYNKGL